LLFSFAARTRRSQAPCKGPTRAARQDLSQTDSAGRPADGPNKIKHSKAQLALDPTRFARFNARRPGTCGPDPSHSPRRVRRTCFASFDSYSSDIHLCRPHDPETANGQRHHDPKPSGPGSTIVRRHGELMQFTSHTVAHACRLRCIRPVVPCYCRLGGHDNRLLLAKPGDAICQTHSDAHVVLAGRRVWCTVVYLASHDLPADALASYHILLSYRAAFAVCGRPTHETSLRGPGNRQSVRNSVDT